MTTTAINELQAKASAIDEQRADLRGRDLDKYSNAGQANAQRLERLNADAADLDKRLWAELNKLTDGELQAYRDEQSAVMADLVARLPALRATADNDPNLRPQLDATYRQITGLQMLIPALDRTIGARREARHAEAARAFTTAPETAQLYQHVVEAEATQLEAVAALAAAHSATGATPNTLPPLPSSPLARLRELTAFVAGVRRCGIKIDTSRLPQSVRAYMEDR
jgi:hypothetical protein